MKGHRKDLEDLLKILAGQGAEISRARSGHYRIRHPQTRKSVCISSTPSDHRSVRNSITRLKKIGFDVLWRRGISQTPRQELAPSR